MLMYRENSAPVDVLPANVSTMESRGWAVTPPKKPAKTKAKLINEVAENGNS
tara:strand:- start:1125 stop:1280 length:156 start_codon:yes stop_codon:yes gene_type:complete